MTLAAQHGTRRFTADEVLRMVETGILSGDEPLELLEGELIVVSPQGPAHSSLTVRLRRRLERAYGERFHVRDHSPVAASERSLPEPDVCVVAGSEDDFLECHPSGEDTLLVVEIACTTRAVDRYKASIYATAGVPIYWLLDVDRGCLEVYERPLPSGEYASRRLLSREETADLPGIDQRWTVAELLPD